MEGSGPISAQSFSPSPSESGLFGFVPAVISSVFVQPSASKSGLSTIKNAVIFSIPFIFKLFVSDIIGKLIGPVVYSQ